MDQGLVVRARQGDRRAFETLATDAYSRLYRLAHGILRDPATADDATQQALVSIWQNLPRLHDPACYDGWCYRLTVKACRDQLRRAPRWADIDQLRDLGHVAHGDIAPVDARAVLEHALSRLSLEHRTVLALRYLLDLTPDGIAESLGIPRKTVYSRLRRATASLRAAMEAEDRMVPSKPVPTEAVR